MAYTTIDDPSAYFHTQLYTGSSSGQSITNDANAGDFKPDWVWIKRRDGDPNSVGNGHHSLYDSSRGVQKEIYADLTNGEATNSNGLTAFGTDGFTVGTEARVNSNGLSFVSWQWKANGGTTASNTDGTITSTVQANTTAGFSIVTHTGTGSAGTIGHGLGVTPNLIIVKNLGSGGKDWAVWMTVLGGNKTLRLSRTEGVIENNVYWGGGNHTSSVIELNNWSNNNENNVGIVSYCFAEKQGYSKIGSFTGNGSSSNGSFVYLGFKPRWLMIKRTNASQSWHFSDTKMKTFNPNTQRLLHSSAAEETRSTTDSIDFLSNGFKCYSNQNIINGDGDTYIYMAFAEHPFVSSDGVPTTAR